MATYMSVRYIDAKARYVRYSYDIVDGLTSAQQDAFVQAAAEAINPLTDMGIVQVGLYKEYDISGWTVATAPLEDASVNDEIMAEMAIADNGEPTIFYIPSVPNTLITTGGAIIENADVIALRDLTVTPGLAAQGNARWADNSGSGNATLRRFRAQRAPKRKRSATS